MGVPSDTYTSVWSSLFFEVLGLPPYTTPHPGEGRLGVTGERTAVPRPSGVLLLDKKHVIENSPQFHRWRKMDMGQRRGAACVGKNLATRLCPPLCDLELVISLSEPE